MLERASQYPDLNFIGIEKSRKYYRKGVKKIQRADLQNIKLIWGEAYHIFKRYIAESSLQNIYVNFPDPWPKYRHRRHRLNQRPFLQLALSRLAPGGSLMWASDYYPQILDVLHLCRPWLEQGLLENSLLPDGFCEALPGYQPSLYEQKWRSLGLQIFYVRLRCREPVPES